MGIEFSGRDHTCEHPRCAGYPAPVDLEDDDPRQLHLSEANGAALLGLLGLLGEGDLRGEVDLPTARRAVMRARATFERRAGVFVRGAEIVHGAPRRDGAAVELSPVRFVGRGLDADELRDRLERFATLVEALAELGATHVAWA